jgi:hypothetical protein
MRFSEQEGKFSKTLVGPRGGRGADCPDMCVCSLARGLLFDMNLAGLLVYARSSSCRASGNVCLAAGSPASCLALALL